MKHPFFTILSLLVLGSCQRKPATAEPAAATEAAATESAAAGRIALSAGQLAHATITRAKVRTGDLRVTLKTTGGIRPNLNRSARVSPTLEGRLIRFDHDLNDRIRAGEVLGQVESPELLGKPLLLRSPIDGVVSTRDASVGELVDKTRPVCTITDPSQVWAIAEVRECDIAAVRTGQDASFTTPAYPGRRFTGKVTNIGNEVEPGSRTIEVRVTVDNPRNELRSGMFAEIELVTGVVHEALMVPERALQTNGPDHLVFAAVGNDTYEARTVRTGPSQDGMTRILDGLRPGEEIAVEGAFLLKSELLKDQLGDDD